MDTFTSSISNRIVVGIDGSPQSRQALQWAAQLATGTGATLRAVTAWEFPATYGWATWPQDWDPARDARRLLNETITETFGGPPPVPTEEIVHEGSAARNLIEESRNASIVVVGSRGHGGIAGMLLGSVSAKVAEHALCPVLVAHGNTVSLKTPNQKKESAGAG